MGEFIWIKILINLELIYPDRIWIFIWDYSRSNYNWIKRKICHWSESQPHISRPQLGLMETSAKLVSQTTKESTSSSSSTHSTSPSSAPLKSSPSATRPSNSETSDAKSLPAQSTQSSPTWSTPWKQERKEDSDQWTSQCSLISTRRFQSHLAAFARMEKKKELLTEPLTSSTGTVLWCTHQSMTCQSEEIPMNTWDWSRLSNLLTNTEKSAQQDGNQDKRPWFQTQKRANTRKSSAKPNDLEKIPLISLHLSY